ncbi:hypothetical protein FOA43_002644 [Brettanomyces nanus]|uniref:NADP-dependent oxidoreductase domain-containing protein n=1 Tax=Eeniella nana TaxID=13502 RepID=A0A875S310_EENNA|nr:uncharacterized protein FOA43_002644 [Brettanomyces nanus]QPG75293.1 hypothetical protein FOA43_002644 [Brettanomyces nanus]
MSNFPMSKQILKIGDVVVPAPGFGAMSLVDAYKTNRDDPMLVLKKAYDLGCRFWDTADVYSNTGYGESERFIGEFLKKYNIPREDIFLCTKFGFKKNGSNQVIDGSPEYCKMAFDRSLKNLGVDYVDLYYLHRVDPNVPIEDSVSAMAEIRNSGKAKFLGISECTAKQLRRANSITKIDAVQREYSLFDRSAEETGLKDACDELGVAFVAYSPLGRGFLTGTFKKRDDINDSRKDHPRFSEGNFDKNLELVRVVEELSKAKGVKPSQFALAWILHQNAIPIPGTSHVARVVENFESRNIHFTDDELKQIRKRIDNVTLVGQRKFRMSNVDA